MSDGLFSPTELIAPGRAGYRLHRLEVFNWGTFDQYIWRLTPDGETSLLTGDIGSGKSTLVDAITTLLLPAHKIAYNKAAGAESKERTLRSYVEGHYKSERVEASGKSRAVGLRDGGTTYSVILGVFANDGYDETVSLAQVFQQRDRSTPDRFFVTSAKGLSVKDDFSDFGTDLNDLRRRLRAGGAEIFKVFPDYARSLRRLLGIKSDQALELFHQTVSMKSVSNLNEFVRDHMLEPSDSTQRVNEIISHFDDLTKAHDAVKRAREQLEALQPIVDTTARYDTGLAEREALTGQRDAVKLYVAEQRSELLAAEIATLEADGEGLNGEKAAADNRAKALSDEREALIEERAREGGDRIGDLERQAREARQQASDRRDRRARFDGVVADAGLRPVADAEQFAALSATVADAEPAIAARMRELNARVADLAGEVKEIGRRRDAVADEVTSLEQRTSNLPASHTDLREQLCDDLGLSPHDVPFAGELLDVTDDHSEWRGAAERVLRGFALSMLVEQDHYDAVARWVNGRRLTYRGRGGTAHGTKLVYERVAARRVPLQRPTGDALVLADCLEAKDGPFREYLLGELTRRADYRCVDTIQAFRTERRAVTREGQVRSGDRHEKDDRTRVDDPRTWVLGWANDRKIAALREELAGLDADRDAAEAARATAETERADHQRRQTAFARLTEYQSWNDLDHAEADDRANRHDAERTRLESGSSRLEEIKNALERNEKEAAAVKHAIDTLTGRLATLAADVKRARSEKAHDDAFVAGHEANLLVVARSAYEALTGRVGAALPTRSAEWSAVESALTDELHKRIERVGQDLNRFGQSLNRAMEAVLTLWPELRSDMDAAVEARADFVTFHQRVATDDLPRHEAEFKRLLNTETIRELAQFNNWLRRQAEEIDTRIDRINVALGAIPYNSGRIIQLEHERTDNQDVKAFRADLRNATDDSLAADDDHYSEQRFLDVKRIIERFRGRESFADADKAWTRRVTDVRNWFVFSASEQDVETGAEWEHYSDSDGKSGGQKEKLAYTILAASLSYQFGLDWGVEKSKDFRFAVIDEAFGRGSDVSTRYALDLFAKLGLQLLIVTPLQKVHVIEPYVKAIGFVDNPTGTRSRLQTMTIEEYRERRERAAG
ncbi:ATP-binding protein [Jiangella anatolica]|uniref:ATP-dependent exonuclease SbcCD, C subunit-like protein n=1 Tax=Jiangella anatolica TaxID=2670374 RepID=A0A2W2B1C6_9ACTN|nr:ATP-binding protein [Jiangella anatolica]PZF81241.1 hypothetical protein C1I92_21890 [Jiangella anatolica]